MGEKTFVAVSLQVVYIEKFLIKGNPSLSKFNGDKCHTCKNFVNCYCLFFSTAQKIMTRLSQQRQV